MKQESYPQKIYQDLGQCFLVNESLEHGKVIVGIDRVAEKEVNVLARDNGLVEHALLDVVACRSGGWRS